MIILQLSFFRCFLRRVKFRREESYIHQQIVLNEEIRHKLSKSKVRLLDFFRSCIILNVFVYGFVWSFL